MNEYPHQKYNSWVEHVGRTCMMMMVVDSTFFLTHGILTNWAHQQRNIHWLVADCQLRIPATASLGSIPTHYYWVCLLTTVEGGGGREKMVPGPDLEQNKTKLCHVEPS